MELKRETKECKPFKNRNFADLFWHFPDLSKLLNGIFT